MMIFDGARKRKEARYQSRHPPGKKLQSNHRASLGNLEEISKSSPDAYVIGTKNRWNEMAHHEWSGYAEERYGFDGVRVKEVTVRRH